MLLVQNFSLKIKLSVIRNSGINTAFCITQQQQNVLLLIQWPYIASSLLNNNKKLRMGVLLFSTNSSRKPWGWLASAVMVYSINEDGGHLGNFENLVTRMMHKEAATWFSWMKIEFLWIGYIYSIKDSTNKIFKAIIQTTVKIDDAKRSHLTKEVVILKLP